MQKAYRCPPSSEYYGENLNSLAKFGRNRVLTVSDKGNSLRLTPIDVISGSRKLSLFGSTTHLSHTSVSERVSIHNIVKQAAPHPGFFVGTDMA